jgi:hypothetical protein
MHKLSVALFLLLNIGNVMAQSSETVKPYRIGAGSGYSFSGYREEAYSPVNRYLNTPSFFIDGNIEKGNFLHSLNMGFFMGNSGMSNPTTAVLKQDYDPQKGEAYYLAILPPYFAIRANLEYALDYRLWGNETFPGFFGGAFRTDAYMQFANYPSITGIVSLAAHASQKWLINAENNLIISISFPLLGYAIRPGYTGTDGAMMKYAEEAPLRIITLGEIISLHNYWAVFGDLNYQHEVNALLSLYSGLGFELSRINIPRPRVDAILRLNTGIAFIF